LRAGQGANDPRVKQAESDQIVNAMAILFPDEGHGLDRPENRLAFAAAAEQFLAAWLGGRSEPIGGASDYYFNQTPADVQLLNELSKIAAAAHAPFLAGAGLPFWGWIRGPSLGIRATSARCTMRRNLRPGDP
jgi:hypothetical protein